MSNGLPFYAYGHPLSPNPQTMPRYSSDPLPAVVLGWVRALSLLHVFRIFRFFVVVVGVVDVMTEGGRYNRDGKGTGEGGKERSPDSVVVVFLLLFTSWPHSHPATSAKKGTNKQRHKNTK